SMSLFNYQEKQSVGLKMQDIVIGILKDNGLIAEKMK
ncbi:aminoglycoside adenylyltransferase, partial [Bacillus subtilis]